MHILYLKETRALLFSGLISLIVNCSSIYSGHAAKSWWYRIYEVRLFKKIYFFSEKYMRNKYKPWFDSYTFYVGRLLKENLFFRENDISRPKLRVHTYFFIYNMLFDIILHTICIFCHIIFFMYIF